MIRRICSQYLPPLTYFLSHAISCRRPQPAATRGHTGAVPSGVTSVHGTPVPQPEFALHRPAGAVAGHPGGRRAAHAQQDVLRALPSQLVHQQIVPWGLFPNIVLPAARVIRDTERASLRPMRSGQPTETRLRGGNPLPLSPFFFLKTWRRIFLPKEHRGSTPATALLFRASNKRTCRELGGHWTSQFSAADLLHFGCRDVSVSVNSRAKDSS